VKRVFECALSLPFGAALYGEVTNADTAGPVAVTASAGSDSVAQGVGRLPDIGAVPCLGIVAALHGDGEMLRLLA
jgi:hypothetical protein